MQQKAFTLVELLMIIAIIFILVTMAVPSFQYLRQQNQLIFNINRLVGALRFGRSQAILYQQTVTICPKAKNMHCGDDWSQGLLIMNKDKLLRVIHGFPGGGFNWNRSRQSIQFLATGYLKGQNGRFEYFTKNAQQDPTRIVILSKTGRIFISSSR